MDADGGHEDKSRTTRANISLDFIVKNEGLADGDYNAYVRSFCRDGDTIERLYSILATDASILKLMNKHGLKKEITECYAAICLVERSLRRKSVSSSTQLYCEPCIYSSNIPSVPCLLVAAGNTGDADEAEPLLTFTAIRKKMASLVFYDVCSGKGILSFLLTLLFPDIPKIVMIDFNASMKVDHLSSECCSHIIYRECDIYTEEFSDYLQSESRECCLNNLIPVVVGLHLCGTLSTRLIQLYNQMNNLPILILSPCCAPTRSKKNKVFMTRERLKRNKWPSYTFWYMSVYVLIDHLSAMKDIIRDELVVSEKNTFIWAVKRTFLS